MKITEIIQEIGRPVAYYPKMAKVFGIKESIFLSQLLYWRGKEHEPERGIRKSSDEIEEETGLTYKEQVRIKDKLKKLKCIEVEYNRLKHQSYYILNEDIINKVYQEHMTKGKVATTPKVSSRTDKKVVRDNPKGKFVYTENTTENTTDICAPKGTRTKTEGKIINEVIEYFKDVNPNYERLYRMKTQREALDRLIVKNGVQETIKIIQFLKISNTHTYAPKITTPYILEVKLGDLKAWADGQKTKTKDKGREIIVA